jgi:hypothetical protein
MFPAFPVAPAYLFRTLVYKGHLTDIPSLFSRFRVFTPLLPLLPQFPQRDFLKLSFHIKLYNGSEIWIGGLGDREQADKILGHEYNTIDFNETSQLSYAAVTTAWSRLAMRVPGCRNLFMYDCNPGSPLHWAYKIFVLKKTFLSGEPLEKPELYASMVLNPEDNKDNLPEDYIADILDVLPEKQKARFRDGLWVKAEGVIYDKFDETMIVRAADLPERFDRYAAGQDFGLNITFVKIGWLGETLYVLCDYGAFNMTTQSFNEALTARGCLGTGGSFCADGYGIPVYADFSPTPIKPIQHY